MRIIEGTPREIAEYLQLTGQGRDGAAGVEAVVAEETVVESVHVETDIAWPDIERLVHDRARTTSIATRVLDYLRSAVALGDVEIGPGVSERTHDGLTDYIMVRDAGPKPQRYGAVVYVKATNGGLTLRLTEEDVTDLDDDPHIGFRDVRDGHQYVVNCPLRSDSAMKLALSLTERALAKVRA
jgi:hypothetical protein